MYKPTKVLSGRSFTESGPAGPTATNSNSVRLLLDRVVNYWRYGLQKQNTVGLELAPNDTILAFLRMIMSTLTRTAVPCVNRSNTKDYVTD